MVNVASSRLPIPSFEGRFFLLPSCQLSFQLSVFADITQRVEISGQNFPLQRLSLTQVQCWIFNNYIVQHIFQSDFSINSYTEATLTAIIFFHIIPTFCSFVIIIKYNLPATVFILGHQIKMLLDYIIKMQIICLVHSRSRWFSGYLR